MAGLACGIAHGNTGGERGGEESCCKGAARASMEEGGDFRSASDSDTDVMLGGDTVGGGFVGGTTNVSVVVVDLVADGMVEVGGRASGWAGVMRGCFNGVEKRD